jgi:hypothetical protein
VKEDAPVVCRPAFQLCMSCALSKSVEAANFLKDDATNR